MRGDVVGQRVEVVDDEVDVVYEVDVVRQTSQQHHISCLGGASLRIPPNKE